MPTSPLPNGDLAPPPLEVEVLDVLGTDSELESPLLLHAAISVASAPAPPAPTILRNFLRDGGFDRSSRRAGSSIGPSPVYRLPGRATSCLRMDAADPSPTHCREVTRSD